MPRLAYAELPAFSLQLLLLDHPDWRGWPAAVVARETALGELLEVNRRARRLGITPGLRYGPALALAPGLRAGTISDDARQRGARAVVERLQRLSPRVEPDPEAPGSCWLEADGLERLHRDWPAFARAVADALAADGFHASVAVGFSHFGSRLLARAARKEPLVAASPIEESELARRAPLARLGLPIRTRQTLERLGVRTIGDLIDLPAVGLLERFGPELHRVHQQARAALWRPLDPAALPDPLADALDLDEPVSDTDRLTFLIKRLLGPLLRRAAARRSCVVGLLLALEPERSEAVSAAVRPAAPTLDEGQLLELLRLRLESLRLAAGVRRLGIELECAPAPVEQLLLFARQPRRDREAAARAFARLRARFGDDAVAVARLVEGHLPEARYRFEPLSALPDAAATPETDEEGAALHGPTPTLVRRIRWQPLRLQARPTCGPRGAHLAGLAEEPVVRLRGSHVLSGGWWIREIHRQYFYAETASGRILWAYFDHCRRRWCIQGEVE